MKSFIQEYHIKEIIFLSIFAYLCIFIYAADYDNIVPKAKETVVVSMAECSGCQVMKPIVQELRNEGIAISLVEGRDQLEKYSVVSVPTTIVFINGQEQRRHVGVITKEALIAFIKGQD